MLKNLFTRASLTLCVMLAIAGCKNVEDLAKYKDQAMALVSQYGPQLKDLGGKLGGLKEKLAGLPASIPGLDSIKGLLDQHQGKLDQLQSLVSGLPEQVTTAAKGGKAEEVKSLLTDATSQLSTGVTELTTGVAEVETKVAEAEKAAAAGAGAAYAKTLEGGFEVKGNAEGVEAQLVAFIEDASKPVDKTTWFNFDRLSFKTGGAELDMEASKEQLTNIAEILKAFPKVNLKVGGYTDNTGKAEANKKLSGERAEAIKAELVKLGIDAKRLEAEGYGAEHPVCPANDTDECKAQNRRIAVRVTAK